MDEADEAGFEAFVRQRTAPLLRTAYLLTGDRGHAEDLLQSVLLKLARQWSSIVGPPEPYARRALVNMAVDGYRRRRVTEATLHDHDHDHDHVATSDTTATVDLRDELVRALFTLTNQQRAVLVLRYFEDLTETDIATALGCSPGAVKSYASRGLARLREITDLPVDRRPLTATCTRSNP